MEDLRLAEAGYCYFGSVAEQIRFLIARAALAKNPQDAAALAEARSALSAEMDLATEFYPLARADSRLGFEAANHYFYRPLDLAEKVVSCDYLLGRFSTPNP